MSADKEKEALTGSDDEKTALKVGDSSADGSLPGMDDSTLDHDHDNSRARFISNNSNNHEKGDVGATPEVYVDVEGKTKTKIAHDDFVGLTKEELMVFANDPKWKKIRLAFLIMFWVGWFAMLVAAVIIIVLAPKCPPKPDLDWWQTSTVYKLFPKSFKDSDGDGIGDLQGVHDELNYLTGTKKSLNISSVLLSSIYPHGGTADGYDVTDYMGVNPDFGTMDDFDNMRVAMHKKGLKLILDFIPNHSSKDHPWFAQSQRREGKYADYYIWKAGNPSPSGPPNDWQSLSGGSAWSHDSIRNEFYLHQFGENQPDLNLRNEHVREELQKALYFWLDKGVDGFRVDSAAYMFECANFTNDEGCRMFQPQSYEIITDWRETLDSYAKQDDKPKFLMVDSHGTVNQTMNFYQYNGALGAHAPINTQLLGVGEGCEAQCVYEKIQAWVTISTPVKVWNNWQIGSMKTSRVATRCDKDAELVNLMNLLVLTLPGTAITYYGEEIAMTDLTNAPAPTTNKYRSPMQWSAGNFAGFTDGNVTWLSLPPQSQIENNNVKTQLAAGAGNTNLEVYTQLRKLRDEPSFQWGNMVAGVAGNVLFYVRQATKFPGFLVAMNLGPSQNTVDFIHSAPEGLKIPAHATVAANTGNFAMSNGEFDVGQKVDLSNLLLREKQGVVFRWEIDPNE